jgi:Xaa-Pro dipeptidase
MLLLYRAEGFNPNFYYHAGVDIDHSFLVAGPRKRILFVPRLNASFAKKNFKGKVVVFEDPYRELSKYVKNRTVLADLSSMNARMAQRLSRICRLRDHTVPLLEQRAKKKRAEVKNMEKAARLTREIFASLDFKSAKTELGLKKQVMLATAELGLKPAFEPIVSTDRNTSYPHYNAGNKKLGSLVLVDYGVRYRHYCSDLTRCFILDGYREKKTRYEKLKNVCHSLVDALPDMKTGKEVAVMAERLMKKEGFPKMIHSIGHGVGLAVHEFPRLSKKYDDRLKGTTFTIEPAFYVGRYGMRFEEMVHFDGKKARVL